MCYLQCCSTVCIKALVKCPLSLFNKRESLGRRTNRSTVETELIDAELRQLKGEDKQLLGCVHGFSIGRAGANQYFISLN